MPTRLGLLVTVLFALSTLVCAENIDAALSQLLPVEGIHAQVSIAQHVRVVLSQIGGIPRLSRKQQRLRQARVFAEQTREFKSGVSGRANDRGLELLSP